jgi:hypothetical protein
MGPDGLHWSTGWLLILTQSHRTRPTPRNPSSSVGPTSMNDSSPSLFLQPRLNLLTMHPMSRRISTLGKTEATGRKAHRKSQDSDIHKHAASAVKSPRRFALRPFISVARNCAPRSFYANHLGVSLVLFYAPSPAKFGPAASSLTLLTESRRAIKG